MEVDSHGKRAGKGPLVQTEKAATVSAVQDQTLISIDRGGGRAGVNLAEEQVPSLTTTHDGAHAVFGIGSMDSNAMKSSNPKSGIYEAETSKTLDPNGVNPACNQGGVAVVSKVGGV